MKGMDECEKKNEKVRPSYTSRGKGCGLVDGVTQLRKGEMRDRVSISDKEKIFFSSDKLRDRLQTRPATCQP
jgi:hypothetical protein